MDATDNTEFQAYPQTPSSDRLIQPFLIALKDENLYVRARAVRALGKIGTEAVVTALLDALHHHQDERVRGWAAWALGREGKLVEVLQRFHDSLWEYEDSDDSESL